MIKTQIFAIDPNRPDPELIRLAASKLVAGQLVGFPTETVYGLGANAFDAEAVDRVFQAKGRPASDPIIVHISSLTQLPEVAIDIPELAWHLAKVFWPGPLTLVLKRHSDIPSNVSAGLDTVAVRVPKHDVPQALLLAAGVPIAAPSANLFTRPSPTSGKHVLEDLFGRIDIVLDAGATSIGLESTVVDLTQTTPTLLRPGGTSMEALRNVIPNLRSSPKYLQIGHGVAASPGMLTKHYSPTAKLLLFTGTTTEVVKRMRHFASTFAAQGKAVGIMAPVEEKVYFTDLPADIVPLGSRSDLTKIGQNLFSGMRELDSRHADVILVRDVGRSGLGLAIWDRLLRAADGHVIHGRSASPDLMFEQIGG